MKFDRVLWPVAALVLALGLTGCDDNDNDDNPDPGNQTATVILQFDHMVGGAPLALNSGNYTNASNEAYTVTKLQYVVSDFTLVGETTLRTADFTYGELHLRDEADATTRELTFTDVPAGDYSNLQFPFGIAPANQVIGAYPDLDAIGMDWPAGMPGDGYHYMKLEGAYTPDGGSQGNYATHTGPSANVDYTVTVDLDLDTTPLRHGFQLAAGSTTTIRLYMDLNEWYTDPNDYALDTYHGGGGGIMGNATAQALLQQNGGSVWSVAEVTAQ